MSQSNRGKNAPRRIPLSELLILLGFVLLVSAAVVTVVIPELQDEPDTKTDSSEVEVGKESNQAKKR